MPGQPENDSSTSARVLPVWLSPAAWVVLVVLVLYFFSPIATIALGLLAACIVACTLQPLVRLVPGPRALGVAVGGLTLLGVLATGLFCLSWPLHRPIASAIEDWPRTKQNIDASLERWSRQFGLEEPLKVDRLVQGLGRFLAGAGGEQLFSRSADVFFGVLLALAFTLVGSVFLLTEQPQELIEPVSQLLSAKWRPRLREYLLDLGPRFRRWVLGTVTGMLVVFVASALGFWSIGLKYAVPLALLAGLAEVIPTIGPACACIFIVLFAAALQTGGKALAVLVVYGAIEAAEAYIILPLIMRGAVNIHPAVTLFTVVLWGQIFGVAGLILAIPINLTIWLALVHFRLRQPDTRDS